jgi:hypothetical protein
MEINMKKLIHEIHEGKNLAANLQTYREIAVPAYNEYAALELTFSAYTMVQEIVEEKAELALREQPAIDVLLDALLEMSDASANCEKTMEQMKKLRQEITQKMDLFTAYTDRLIVYEYVMNRLELHFLPEKELNRKLSAISEEAFLKDLLAWIFSDKDQSVVRDKLRLVIGQIPPRMTKTKFFEKIEEALTLYKDGDKSSLEDFIYMLRTSAMVYSPAHYVGEYKEIEAVLSKLEKADFSSITEEQYEELAGQLEEGARMIHEITDFYYSLQKVVNNIYALCLTMPYGGNSSKLIRACQSIWRCLAKKQYMDEMLVPLEGRIEAYVEKTSYLESVLYEIKSEDKEEAAAAGLTDFFEDFSIAANLLSDSLFIDLDKVRANEKADASYVKKCSAELIAELSTCMETVSRPVKRAIMSQVLEKMPLMFQKTEEVEEYIRVNLLGCQDKAEKLIVMSILTDFIREEM